MISKALKLNYFSKLENKILYLEKNRKFKDLDESQIKELQSIGLNMTEIKNIFITPVDFMVTSIWFYRTKHAWYWTPKIPQKNELNKSNWMIIYIGNNLNAIGGTYNGFPPAPKNIDIIHWLETSRLKYL